MPLTQLTEEENILQSPDGPVRTHTDFLKRVILERNYDAGKCFLHFGAVGVVVGRTRHPGGWDKVCITQEGGEESLPVLNAGQISYNQLENSQGSRPLPGLSKMK